MPAALNPYFTLLSIPEDLTKKLAMNIQPSGNKKDQIFVDIPDASF